MFCRHCGFNLPKDSQFCTKCGRPCSPPPDGSQSPTAKRLVRWIVFAVVCVLVAIAAAVGTATYRNFAELRASVVYHDAISKAQNSPQVTGALGAPVRSVLVPWGFLRLRGNFGSAFLLSLVTGPRGTGLLHAAVKRENGVWRYSLLQVTPTVGRQTIDLLKPNAINPAELPASGRVYLVSFGPLSKISLQKLVDHFSKEYHISMSLLPELPLDESVIDVHRDQAVAEEMLSVMKRSVPQLRREQDAFVIAITDRDMYARDWSYAFNYYNGRMAVVSTARLDPHIERWQGMPDLLEQRVLKLVARDLGMLYYKLPYRNDPTSLMYSDLSYISDVDRLQESYLGAESAAIVTEYPVTQPAPPLEPVIRKQVARVIPGSGDYPCLVLEPLSPSNVQLQGKETSCRQTLTDTSPVERYEVALATGLFVLRQTDLVLPDSMPLVLTRTYSSWDTRSNSFGIGTNHPYDTAPFGKRNPYNYLELALADGTVVSYPRISEGTGYRDALFEHTSSDGLFYGSQFRWNGNGWDLKFRDGSIDRFPEAYWAINPQQAALVGIRSPNGEQIRFERDLSRRLMRLVSPHGQQIRFSYDTGARIVQLNDGAGHVVNYVYDQGGRLVRVLRSGVVVRQYSYDYNYLLSVEDGSGHKLLVNKYDDTGRIHKQTLADGSTWQFRYTLDKENNVTAAEVIDPAGHSTRVPVAHGLKSDDSSQN